MRVPDLSYMIQMEEYFAVHVCVRCGEMRAMHSIMWLQNGTDYDEGKVVWLCRPGLDNKVFESLLDAGS